MKTKYRFDIPKPCSEKWDDMKSCGQDKDCSVCAKTVCDFTTKSDAEILEFVRKRKNEVVCGRFTESQLNRPLLLPPSIWRRSLRLLLPTALLFGSYEVHANEPVPPIYRDLVSMSISDSDSVQITGRLTEKDTDEPLIFANVFIKGTKIGTLSDEKGYFNFAISKELLSINDTLKVTYIGFETFEVKVDQTNCTDLQFEIASTAHFIGTIIYKKEPFYRRIFKRRNKKDDE